MFKSLTEPTHGSLHVRVAKKVTRHVGSLHIALFRCAAEFGRHRGIADMAGLAAGLPRSRMTHSVTWSINLSRCTSQHPICDGCDPRAQRLSGLQVDHQFESDRRRQWCRQRGQGRRPAPARSDQHIDGKRLSLRFPAIRSARVHEAFDGKRIFGG